MKYMLDTNTCIFIQKGVPSVLRRLDQAQSSGIAISVLVLAELEHGVAASAYPERNSISLKKFLTIGEVVPFDPSAAREYGRICADLQKRGQPIGPIDKLIAAHAKSAGLILVTNNTREFSRVEGLALEDWLIPSTT